MGGTAPVDSGKTGRKSLDAELNLVPFIDLLSCLISFLLITAVWTQITSIRVAPDGGIDSEPTDDTLDLRVTMTDRGYILTFEGSQVDLPKVMVQKVDPEGNGTTGPRFDTRTLAEKLKIVKARYQAQRAVTVAAEDAIPFDDLVGTIDAIVALDLPDIRVTAAVN